MEHQYKHTGEKPYKCTYGGGCGKTFRQKSSYFRHLKYQHREKEPKAALPPKELEIPPFPDVNEEELFGDSVSEGEILDKTKLFEYFEVKICNEGQIADVINILENDKS